jgi:hypothetical protein
MFAITTHFREAEDRARQQRNVGVALVLLTGLGAVVAGLLIDAMTSLNAFAGFAPV